MTSRAQTFGSALVFGRWVFWLGVAIAVGGPAAALGSQLYATRRAATNGRGPVSDR